MSTFPLPPCATCRHFYPQSPPLTANAIGEPTQRWGLYCKAFPTEPGIPDTILHGVVDHTQPVEGDHGVTFAAGPADDLIGPPVPQGAIHHG